MILGLDVSTSTTGYCVLASDGTIKEIGYIPLSREPELAIKGVLFMDKLTDILDRFDVDRIIIEKIFTRYGKGMSSAQTITRLASFNGIVQFICYQQTGKIPELIPVAEARKIVGIKTTTKKKAGKPVKEQVFEWALENVDYQWPTKVLKSGPRKGQTTYLNEAYDMCDAWVVAKSGCK